MPGKIFQTAQAIIGEYYHRLQEAATPWVEKVSFYIDSDQPLDTLPFTGAVPGLELFRGARQPQGLRAKQFTIGQRLFDSTMEIPVDWLRKDKTGQIQMRISEHARKGSAHWPSLLSTLIANGETGLAYDGMYYFDTARSWGGSGAQSNLLSIDISGLPVPTDQKGSATDPSVGEIAKCIQAAIVAAIGFTDDRGDLFDPNPTGFLVMVPLTMLGAANEAVTQMYIGGCMTNSFKALADKQGFSVDVTGNPLLGWTDSFAVFNTSTDVKGLIRKGDGPDGQDIRVMALDENSEHATLTRNCQFIMEADREVEYGEWRSAVKVTMF